MKDILTLADGTTLELESGSTLGKMQVIFWDKESMVETWDSLTNENLKSVQMHSADGTLIAEYADLVCGSVTSTEQEDETILTTFALRGKTATELLAEKTKALEEQNAMLTECVLEMSEVVYGG